MKFKTVLFYIVVGTSLLYTQREEGSRAQNVDYVDPFICTGSDHGQTDPAAGVPFGMAKPAPDSHPLGHSGYNFDADEILGFSNTRFSGVGCRGVGGNLRILPYIGSSSPYPNPRAYKKETERAQAGYYTVELEDGIRCEFTATRQVAFHRYTFPKSETVGLTIDLTSSLSKFYHEKHHIQENGVIMGEISGANVCDKGKYTFYYALATSLKNFNIEEKDGKIFFSFKTPEENEVRVLCAISTVSAQSALKNLQQFHDKSFEEVKRQAHEEWANILSVVEVEGENNVHKKLFYTHLYHVLQTPFQIQDEDGSFRGSDGKIYGTDRADHYHGWSIWDTFRTKLPLLSLLYPEYYKDMVSAIGKLYQQGKPDWATEKEPFLTVRTEHSGIVVLEAHKKGLLPFSLESIYPHLKEEARQLPFETPDNVLESSYDLWALSQVAREIGKGKEYRKYQKKAINYRKTWKEKFLTMDENSDIMHGDGLYEGTLWQYRWLVPYDIKGIQKLLGGKKVFEEQLDYFFDNELFNIGNQPDIQVPYLYVYTRSPWKTQKLVNRLMTKKTNNWYGTHEKWKTPSTRKIFQATPHGYIREMDDDAGTMSAWFVCSAIGLYPVFPGSTQLALTTPLFQKIAIKTPGKPLQIVTNGFSTENIFIQKVTWNGDEINSSLIDFNMISRGGVLQFELGNKPKPKRDKNF
ncbi:GH92 family glycosyl hydrolase [Allomuricauda sp. SCSIO 65647]|uniref:GH92 family glycosyl hydrolase n=1 Tax=Allomuricauda sp. SCSIO 65647 TaxID=2908843 RepID=UPI001F18E9EF|nr:GH92 family glycosyl hydrolase [Muricauda sp. SCSIO 65647]UJH68580.1 glycoside hydrolase family 92 protein [Muricauda sp. SCSIO 65647]